MGLCVQQSSTLHTTPVLAALVPYAVTGPVVRALLYYLHGMYLKVYMKGLDEAKNQHDDKGKLST